jgi:hypothetical protein
VEISSTLGVIGFEYDTGVEEIATGVASTVQALRLV